MVSHIRTSKIVLLAVAAACAASGALAGDLPPVPDALKKAGIVRSAVKKLAGLKGKTVVVMKGAWQIDWFEKNMSEVKLLKLDNVSDGLQALLQSRADGFAHDFAILVGIAKKNAKTELVGELYQIGFRGIGVRKGDTAMRAYVNASIKKPNDDAKIGERGQQ